MQKAAPLFFSPALFFYCVCVSQQAKFKNTQKAFWKKNPCRKKIPKTNPCRFPPNFVLLRF
jgi:hypothetical protein